MLIGKRAGRVRRGPGTSGSMRFLTAAFFVAGAAYVWWYNNNHLDRLVLAWVFDLLVPSSKGDPITQGRWTVWTLAGVGGVFFVRDLIWTLRVNRSLPPRNPQ